MKGAFWGLITGLCLGLIRFIWQFSYKEPSCLNIHLDRRPLIISKIHFLHFGIILFIITCSASWIISLLTPPIPYKYIRRLTYFSIDDPLEPEPMPTNQIYIEKEDTFNLVNFLETNDKHVKMHKKVFFWLCGIEKYLNFGKNSETKDEKIDTSIEENRFWSGICDANAVIAMAFCGFCYAFFNRFN